MEEGREITCRDSVTIDATGQTASVWENRMYPYIHVRIKGYPYKALSYFHKFHVDEVTLIEEEKKSMKFNDIKTFPHSSYKVNMSWGYIESWLEEQGSFYDLQLDPEFQRGYRWTEHQKTKYIEYRLRGGLSGRDIYWNCPGWNMTSKQGDPLQLVDGKQRLNAVREFLKGNVTVFGGLTINNFDKLPPNKYDFIVHINNLESQKDVVEWYLGLNAGGSIHTEEDLKPAYNMLKKIEQLS